MNPREKIYRESWEYFKGLSDYNNPFRFVYLEMEFSTLGWLSDELFDDHYFSIKRVEEEGFSGFWIKTSKGELEVDYRLEANTPSDIDDHIYNFIRFPIVLNRNVPYQKVRMTDFLLTGKRVPSYWFGDF
jgi:hypothetical protein